MTRYDVAAAALALSLTMGGPAAAQTANSFAQANSPAQSQADAVYPNYKFRSGETLETLRFHYTTMGTPHRNKDGQLDNAVLILHWTGGNARQLMTPTFVKSLYAPGKPLDVGRYFLILPDSIGCGESSKPSNLPISPSRRRLFKPYGTESGALGGSVQARRMIDILNEEVDRRQTQCL
jgi:homoserine O-acetyltransferase/O-succinyltransferase